MFVCQHCNKTFNLKQNLNRHISTIHDEQKESFACSKCEKTFKQKSNRDRHELKGKCVSTNSRKRAAPVADTAEAGPSKRRNTTDEQEEKEFVSPDDEMYQEYSENAGAISTNIQDDGPKKTFNFAVDPNTWSMDDVNDHLSEIYEYCANSIKINLSFGRMLQHVETGEFRYFSTAESMDLLSSIYKACECSAKRRRRKNKKNKNQTGKGLENPLGRRGPFSVTSRDDIKKFVDVLQKADLESYCQQDRPDTKWKCAAVTNITYYVTETGFPMGCSGLTVPEFIKSKQSIITLDTHYKYGPYKDNLCFFRCLAHHMNPETRDNRKLVKQLFKDWCTFEGRPNRRAVSFKGVTPADISRLEQCFEMNIYLFELSEIKSDERSKLKKQKHITSGATIPKTVCIPYMKSKEHYKDTMRLNVYFDQVCHGDNKKFIVGHLSYIKNFQQYACCYKCSICDKMFTKLSEMTKHRDSCTGKVKKSFPGGFHKIKDSLWDRLASYGVYYADLPVCPRVREYLATFDFECYLRKPSPEEMTKLNSEKTSISQIHVPISVSIASNIPDYEGPTCIIDRDPKLLVEKFVAHLSEIQARHAELMCEKYEKVLTKLDKMYHDIQQKVENGDDKQQKTHLDKYQRGLKSCKQEFERYCKRLAVIGYNSARYDLNVIFNPLLQELGIVNAKRGTCNIIKQGTARSSITTPKFKFRDFMKYQAPCQSYDKVIRAEGIYQTKGYFPYDWFDSPEKLDYPDLPPQSAFYSAIKKENTLGKDQTEINANYSYLQDLWRGNNWSSFRDHLVWYNNLDVGPLLEACERQQLHWYSITKSKVDIFEDVIGVPGIAGKELYRYSAEYPGFRGFWLPDEQHKYLHEKIDAGIVGGPSIAFTRELIGDKTILRGHQGGDRVCKSIVGFDANSLYLWCIGQPMPTGVPVIWKPGQKPVYACRNKVLLKMYTYIDYIAACTEEIKRKPCYIQHKLNTGREHRVGPYLIDGYFVNSNGLRTAIEFNGCYYHCHDCRLAKNATRDPTTVDQKREDDKKKHAFLKQLGYNVIVKHECEYDLLYESSTKFKAFVDARQQARKFHYKHKNTRSISSDKLEEGIRTGELFGFAEVDVSVPPEKFKKFEEMAPIFNTADINLCDIGPTMQDYVKQQGLEGSFPRRQLVGGLKAEKILLATPLLQFYLEQGLVIDCIHEVLEFIPQECFQKFTNTVVACRRDAVKNASQAPVAEKMKLLGNSAYGKTIENLEGHTVNTYFSYDDTRAIHQQVNSGVFNSLHKLEDTIYEVDRFQKCIRYDRPKYIGKLILDYAKLRMLQFYYLFLQIFIDYKDYEMLHIDTDSNYFGVSVDLTDLPVDTLGKRQFRWDLDTHPLLNIIKPSLKNLFMNKLKSNCRDDWVPLLDDFFPRQCCPEHNLHDQKTQGLFKVEAVSKSEIVLCSKNYALYDKQGNMIKVAAKGTKIAQNWSTLAAGIQEALETRAPVQGENTTFIKDPKTGYMMTTTQQKDVISAGYYKRQVLEDFVHTKPLDICL